MAQHKASILKAHRHQDDSGMEFTALAVGEPNAGDALRAAIAVKAFGTGVDVSSNVEDEVTLTKLLDGP